MDGGLARLAVDERAKSQGLGSLLLRAVLVLVRQMSENLGCIGLVVDAKPEAIAFYDKLGFMRLELVPGELGDRPAALPMVIDLGQLPDAKP